MTRFTQQECLEKFIQAQENFKVGEHQFNLDNVISGSAPIQKLSEPNLILLTNRLRSNEINVSNQLLQKDSSIERNLYLKELLKKVKNARKALVIE